MTAGPAIIEVVVTEKGKQPVAESFAQTEVLVGSHDTCEIRGGDLSPRHCRLVQRDGVLIVVDMKSESGTYVNGKRIASPQVVKPTDKIYVGDWTLVALVRRDAPLVEAPAPTTTTTGANDPLRGRAVPPGLVTAVTVRRGDSLPEERVELTRPLGIGRHPQNEIVVDNRSLSRFHARFERRGASSFVVDCGAQNGVTVNGVRVVGEAVIGPGDVVGLSGHITVVCHGAAATATASARAPTSKQGTIVVDDDVAPVPPGRRS